jgi:hypothetical protein
MKFLKDFIPWYSSDDSPTLYEGDFRKDEFDRMKIVYDMDSLHAKLANAFGEPALNGSALLWNVHQVKRMLTFSFNSITYITRRLHPNP